MDRFVQVARDHDKIRVNDDLTLTIITPPTIPPQVEGPGKVGQSFEDKMKGQLKVGDYLN